MTLFKTLNRKNTRSAKWDSAQKKTKNPDVIPMSVADSDYATAPSIIEALKDRVDHGAFGYTYSDKTFYDTLSAWIKRRYGFAIKDDWVLTAPKVLTALAIAVEANTDVDEAVVIQTPVYHMFAKTIKGIKRTVVNNPLNRQGTTYTMDLENLEQHFKAGVKTFVLCSPHNPVGRVFTPQELDALLTLCKAYDVTIISDEIHADLIMEGNHFHSMGQYFNAYENIVIVHAPSKAFNLAGLQTAFIIAKNARLKTRIKELLDRYYLSSLNTLGLTALIAAYQHGDAFIDAQNDHIFKQYNRLKARLKSINPAIDVTPLEGTYLAWVDARAVFQTKHALTTQFEASGVVVSEGSTFAKEYEGFFRLNLACSHDQLETVLNRIENILKP